MYFVYISAIRLCNQSVPEEQRAVLLYNGKGECYKHPSRSVDELHFNFLCHEYNQFPPIGVLFWLKFQQSCPVQNSPNFSASYAAMFFWDRQTKVSQFHSCIC